MCSRTDGRWKVLTGKTGENPSGEILGRTQQEREIGEDPTGERLGRTQQERKIGEDPAGERLGRTQQETLGGPDSMDRGKRRGEENMMMSGQPIKAE